MRVTAPVALARQHLVPRLADFLRAQPEVRVELELSDRLSALSMEGLDLAIRHTAAPPDTFSPCTSSPAGRQAKVTERQPAATRATRSTVALPG